MKIKYTNQRQLQCAEFRNKKVGVLVEEWFDGDIRVVYEIPALSSNQFGKIVPANDFVEVAQATLRVVVELERLINELETHKKALEIDAMAWGLTAEQVEEVKTEIAGGEVA